MIEVQLTKNKVALIDDEDGPRVLPFKWTSLHIRRKGADIWYARRNIRPKGQPQRAEYLHRVILNAPSDKQVDHKNGDGLDCRRNNLRLATSSNNQHNRARRHSSNSGFKGVEIARSGRAIARICCRYKRMVLGTFNTPEEAARAYDAKAKELFGEFARLNFPA